MFDSFCCVLELVFTIRWNAKKRSGILSTKKDNFGLICPKHVLSLSLKTICNLLRRKERHFSWSVKTVVSNNFHACRHIYFFFSSVAGIKGLLLVVRHNVLTFRVTKFVSYHEIPLVAYVSRHLLSFC